MEREKKKRIPPSHYPMACPGVYKRVGQKFSGSDNYNHSNLKKFLS